MQIERLIPLFLHSRYKNIENLLDRSTHSTVPSSAKLRLQHPRIWISRVTGALSPPAQSSPRAAGTPAKEVPYTTRPKLRQPAALALERLRGKKGCAQQGSCQAGINSCKSARYVTRLRSRAPESRAGPRPSRRRTRMIQRDVSISRIFGGAGDSPIEPCPRACNQCLRSEHRRGYFSSSVRFMGVNE